MKLKWSLAELQKHRDGYFPISGEANLANSLKNRRNDLIHASSVDVQGMISTEGRMKYYVDLTLEVTLTLPSSRSLEPVDLNLEIPFHEVYLAPDAGKIDEEDILEEDLFFTLDKDMIDLKKPIEDTILTSIPMKILSEEEQHANDLPSGQDWSLKLEDEVDSDTASDESTSSKPSPFDVLKDMDLFNEEEED